jgi:predicted AlkP superfamily pyrophosphatase or phosphodiesterase
MKKLLVALALFSLGAQQSRPVPVVLISIDGLMPEQLLNPDRHALKIANLRRLVAEGTHAAGVKGVLPTVTYPSHTTMVTGVAPAKHGIHANTPFDPFGKNLDGWYWYAEDIKVETLWHVLRKSGMTTASVDWPVSVGAPIDFNIAQYWRAGLTEDVKVIRALSTPGLLAEAQRATGASYPDGNDYTVAADERRAAFNTFILERKRPRFMTVYFSGLDHTQHETTAGSEESRQALEAIDGLVGKVRAAAESAGGGRAVICVVSDHGFARTERELHLNSALREAGLIRLDEAGKVAAWEAFSWNSGGLGAIMLRNTQDTNVRDRVREVLQKLANDASRPVHRIVEGAEAAAIGGFPNAAFVAALRPPFRTGSELRGPVTREGRVRGTHGYLPELPEMNSSLVLHGPGVPAGRSLDIVDMRDIAPTLAALLGVKLQAADGRNLLAGGKRE